MDTSTFRPSLDWGDEFYRSLWWLAEVFALTAPCLVLALFLLGRFTEWGRQYWRITGAYFTGKSSLLNWGLLALMLASTIVSVRINVLLSYQVNDLFNALQVAFEDPANDSGVHGFWTTMVVFTVLAVLHVLRYLADLYLTQRFIMRWRIWLSHNVIDDWLGEGAYFRSQFSREPVDNPDQRIQQDVDTFTTGVGGQSNVPAYGSGQTLLFGAVWSVLSVFSFGTILWQLSGPLQLWNVTVPRALFWIVLLYVLIGTIVSFTIGRPMIRLSYLNELRNAGFRYALVRVRDASAAIGLYKGEQTERGILSGRLQSVMDNYRGWLNRMIVFTGWNLSMSQAINPLPYIVQAQRLFAREISFGGVMQSATAFHMIHDSLSFFRNAYDSFASFRGATIRLNGLLEANHRARALTPAPIGDSLDDAVDVRDLDVRTPGGRHLVNNLDFHLEPGESLLITGASGIGKTVLVQSIAGLWPFRSGTVTLPGGQSATMFVPQLPYLPLGSLRAVVSYPRDEGAVGDRQIQEVLSMVALSQLVLHVGEERDWAKTLSVGEQQRLAFARVLLTRPKAVFLDESTSAMDEGLELMLYQKLRDELPATIIVSISHRATIEQFHGRRLELLGDGDWRLDRVGAST
ncbi:ABC transporter ATP-binding protein/permease [Mycobacterium sp. NBC_00419]|uniref:ABC transporter ATP-binding protein/permease n=1 Tax=Mycobacterium sp. NBC_00419 TaxID=2975989 RepID=UPI002E24CC4E